MCYESEPMVTDQRLAGINEIPITNTVQFRYKRRGHWVQFLHTPIPQSLTYITFEPLEYVKLK